MSVRLVDIAVASIMNIFIGSMVIGALAKYRKRDMV